MSGATIARPGKALRESCADLSPRSPPMRFSPHPLHRSEIMTSGWCGGDRVGCGSLQFRRKPSRQGPVRRSSRYHARVARCGVAQGTKPGTHEPGGSNEGGAGIPAADRAAIVLAMRQGMRPGTGGIGPKPRPAGEA